MDKTEKIENIINDISSENKKISDLRDHAKKIKENLEKGKINGVLINYTIKRLDPDQRKNIQELIHKEISKKMLELNHNRMKKINELQEARNTGRQKNATSTAKAV